MQRLVVVIGVVLVTCSVLSAQTQERSTSNNVTVALGERETVQLYCTTKYSRGLAQQLRISASWQTLGYRGLGVFLRMACSTVEEINNGTETWFRANSWPAWPGQSRLEVGVAPGSVCLVDLVNMGSPTTANATVARNLECLVRR